MCLSASVVWCHVPFSCLTLGWGPVRWCLYGYHKSVWSTMSVHNDCKINLWNKIKMMWILFWVNLNLHTCTCFNSLGFCLSQYKTVQSYVWMTQLIANSAVGWLGVTGRKWSLKLCTFLSIIHILVLKSDSTLHSFVCLYWASEIKTQLTVWGKSLKLDSGSNNC